MPAVEAHCLLFVYGSLKRGLSNHHELGPIALAVLKRSVDPAAPLTVPSAAGPVLAAVQQVIVPPDAGAEANVPRLPRVGAVRR